MEHHIGTLETTERAQRGKGNARKLRQQGLIPAVLYGQKGESVALTLDPLQLAAALDPVKRYNTPIDLTIKAQDGKTVETQKVLVKQHDIDCLRQNLIHVDFIRLDPSKPVLVDVPLKLEGRCAGVQLGGQLNQVFRTIPVRCVPDRIPSTIVADVTTMQIGSQKRARELELPEGIEVCLRPEQTIALVVAGRGAAAAAEGSDAASADAETA